MTDRQAQRQAVFLDRDGTLNREVNYLHRPENFEWVPGAPEAVRRLNDAGLLTVVVTNQSGVARGYYEEEAVHRLHRHMQDELERYGASLDAFYYSPYHPEGEVAPYDRMSACRKPNPGMFEQALNEWKIDPQHSFVVGDKNTDLAPGHQLGMTTILVRTGYGREECAETNADYIEDDLAAAARRIEQLCSREAA